MDNYTIIQELGSGCFGNAYKVLNKNDNRTYVMKKIPRHNIRREKMQEFKKEAEILSIFNNDHIVKFKESFYSTNSFNIVMEYCDGGTLKSYIDRHKENHQKIDKETIYKFVKDICKGLKDIQRQNIIHKDLKPDNLFLTSDLKVKIGDFGISKKLYNSRDYANTAFGPTLYMSPEQLKQDKFNYKNDIWSLGCVIHELCTLEICFKSPHKILEGRYKKIDVNYYGNFLQNLIDILLSQDYHKRPKAEEIIDFINQKKVPREMINHNSHFNNISHSPFHNHDEFRPHSFIGPSNISRVHKPHHRINPFNSERPELFRPQDPDFLRQPNAPLNGPNMPPHGILRSHTFMSEPPIFPGAPHLMPHGPIEPPSFIPGNPGFGPHFMPVGPGPMGPNFAPSPPPFNPPGQGNRFPLPPPPIHPPF